LGTRTILWVHVGRDAPAACAQEIFSGRDESGEISISEEQQFRKAEAQAEAHALKDIRRKLEARESRAKAKEAKAKESDGEGDGEGRASRSAPPEQLTRQTARGPEAARQGTPPPLRAASPLRVDATTSSTRSLSAHVHPCSAIEAISAVCRGRGPMHGQGKKITRKTVNLLMISTPSPACRQLQQWLNSACWALARPAKANPRSRAHDRSGPVANRYSRIRARGGGGASRRRRPTSTASALDLYACVQRTARSAEVVIKGLTVRG
jgi:hypothetical protein